LLPPLLASTGPDGALSASKYAYVGGFDGTSNVLAGKLTGIAISGTHAHAYVMTYSGLHEIKDTTIKTPEGSNVEFLALVLQIRAELGFETTNSGELAAFVSYAQAFPAGTLCLVDTYDTLQSGVLNYICVACALLTLGYTPRGIRLDSGDLSYLSKAGRKLFDDMDTAIAAAAVSTPALHAVRKIMEATPGGWRLGQSVIVASNDINEDVLIALSREGHEIDCFGIGTHLVTCQKQPALGCVYKLVEINGIPRIKLSQEVEKLVIPCSKNAYRLYGKDGQPLNDFMTATDEPAPEVGVRLLCRHPFSENLRAYVTPSRVESLLQLVFDGPAGFAAPVESLEAARDRCRAQLQSIRNDVVRTLNPTPYKVSTSPYLFDYMHRLWLEEAPVADLS
jgi:nicotinate phosphoribosyltransferase